MLTVCACEEAELLKFNSTFVRFFFSPQNCLEGKPKTPPSFLRAASEKCPFPRDGEGLRRPPRGRGCRRERGWEYNGGGRGVATATAARAALRGGHVARAALSLPRRARFAAAADPHADQGDAARFHPTVLSVLEASNGVHARGCDGVLVREQSLRLLVALSDRPERSPL